MHMLKHIGDTCRSYVTLHPQICFSDKWSISVMDVVNMTSVMQPNIFNKVKWTKNSVSYVGFCAFNECKMDGWTDITSAET